MTDRGDRSEETAQPPETGLALDLRQLGERGEGALLFDDEGRLTWATPAGYVLLGLRASGEGDGAVPLALVPHAARLAELARGAAPLAGTRLERLRVLVGRRADLLTLACRRIVLSSGQGVLLAVAMGRRPTLVGRDAVASSALPDFLVAPLPAAPAAPAVEPDSEPAPEPAPTPAAEPLTVEALRTRAGRSALRVVWRTDAEGRVLAFSPEISDLLGMKAVPAEGEILAEATRHGLVDGEGRLASALARHETFNGLPLLYPVPGTGLFLPVAMSGVPGFDAARHFEGFRGFGVCRLDALVPAPVSAAPAAMEGEPASAALPVADTGSATGEPERLDVGEAPDDPRETADTTATPAPDVPATEPPPASTDTLTSPSGARADGLAPSSTVVPFQPMQGAVQGQMPPTNVVRLKPSTRPELARPGQPGLSRTERHAFREIARALGARVEGEDEAGVPTGGADARNEHPSLPAPAPADGTSGETGQRSAPEAPISETTATAPLGIGGVVKPAAAPPATPEAPNGKAPITTSPITTSPVEKAPVDKAPVAHEPVVHEPVVHEPVAHEPVAHEPAASQPAGAGKDMVVLADREPVEAAADEHAQALEAAAEDAAQDDDAADDAAQDDVTSDDEGPAKRPMPASSLPTSGTNPAAVLPAAGLLPAQAAATHTGAAGMAGDLTKPVEPSKPADTTRPVETTKPVEPTKAVETSPSSEPAVAGHAVPGANGTSSARERAETDDTPAEDIAGNAEAIFDRLPVGILVSRGEVPIFANRALLELTGHSDIDSLHGDGGLRAIFAHDGPGGVGPEGRTVSIVRRDGEAIAVEARMQSVPWGGLPATLLTLRRTGEPESGAPVLEAALGRRDREARELRAIMDTATDGVVVIDEDGRILSINRSGEALFGYDQAQIAGETFITLFAPDSHATALDYLDGLRANGVASVLNDGREVVGRVRQGGRIPLFMTLGAISDAPERKFCAVLRDITSWKKAETDLTEAKRVAEEASAQKSDFLAKISHEIRTPLSAIIGFAEVMIEERFGPIGNERYLEYLRDIHASGGHVISLVNDLLDLSKIEAGRFDLTFVSVDVNEIVTRAVSLLQPQAGTGRVVVRSSLAAQLPRVVADERSLRQIVLNLLSNGIKFTDPGGQVIVSTALTDEGEVAVRIRDTGIGMTDKEIETALEPFRQIATARRAGGTGLGLPLTKALVEANRASLSIRSARDAGTLVEITFPTTRVLQE